MIHELHCYEYVHRPFASVRDAVVEDALRFLGPATEAAAQRARVLVDTLSVSIAGMEVGKKVHVTVESIQPHASAPGHIANDALCVEIQWRAASQEGLFPSMKANLFVYPLSAHETQLDLHGVYEPPGGALGAVADRLAGHRIARAAVHRFLGEIRARLVEEIPDSRARARPLCHDDARAATAIDRARHDLG